MLENADTLQTIAEVSVTLAGFISVVLVFQRGTPAEAKVGRNTIVHLLITSIGTLVMSLIPLILSAALSSSELVWRLSFTVLGLIHGGGATRALIETVRGEILVPGPVSYVLVIGSYLILALSLCVAAGLFPDIASAAYLIALGWLLGVSVTTFVSMVLRGSA